MSEYTDKRDKALDYVNKEAKQGWAAIISAYLGSKLGAILLLLLGFFVGWFTNSIIGLLH